MGFVGMHDDIRAVVMNGSRANPLAHKDPFQDYDIACYVRDVEPFRRNPEIPRHFGEILILQTPEDILDPAPANEGSYSYLMLFMDGNRIDLSFHPLDSVSDIREDSLSVVLLDKDQLIGVLPPSGDGSYYPGKPTAKAFDDCCNEFWWLNSYVAKGLWRGELTYAREHLDIWMRERVDENACLVFWDQDRFQKVSREKWQVLARRIRR